MAKMLPMLDPFAEIRRLYFSTTRDTIDRDLQRALELLKQMPSEEHRDRAAGLVHGLTDLRREWQGGRKGRDAARKRAPAPPAGSPGRQRDGKRSGRPLKPKKRR